MTAPRPAPDRPAPFRLTRWFAVLGAVVIGALAWANAWVISSFLTDQLFQREATLSREFVHNVLVSDGSLGYLRNPADSTLRARFEGSAEHLTNMRDTLRTNVYGANRVVLWSSDRQLVGRRFDQNDELDEAMHGQLVVHAGRIDSDERGKPEHVGLSHSASFFVETYIPVVDPGTGQVAGVVELYKAPIALSQAIEEGQRRVTLVALVGALALYLSLSWLVRRADRTMQLQRKQLIEAETLAAVGEMATSVAHNIRNPLASIRSSAELALELPEEHGEECARDILRETDRLSARITELLRLANQGGAEVRHVTLGALLAGCVAEQAERVERRGQRVVFDNRAPQATTLADPQLLQQVVQSLLANAAEAMSGAADAQAGPAETRVTLSAEPRGPAVIEIHDQGPGMTAELQALVFRPFFTTKPQGLGLGLPFARRIVQRLGGQLALVSAPGQGTTVRIELPQA